MTTAAFWASEVERARSARGFIVMVEHARATKDAGQLLGMIGPPGRLTDVEVSNMLIEAEVMSLGNARVLAEVEWWRDKFTKAARGLSDAASAEVDEILERVGRDACDERYWLALLALAWFTEAGVDEMRREVLAELRREQAAGAE